MYNNELASFFVFPWEPAMNLRLLVAKKSAGSQLLSYSGVWLFAVPNYRAYFRAMTQKTLAKSSAMDIMREMEPK